MHVMHADCIREIINSGLRLIYIIGSANTAFDESGERDKLFDPIKNPMTVEQQKQQLFYAFPELRNSQSIIILPVKDMGNLPVWCENLCSLFDGNNMPPLEKCVLHFRSKDGDNYAQKTAEYLQSCGLNTWYSENPHRDDYNINSTELRSTPLYNKENPLLKNIIALEYIREIVSQARKRNPNRVILDKNNFPLTTFDLTFDRIYKEAGISTDNFINEIKEKDFRKIEEKVYKILHQ